MTAQFPQDFFSVASPVAVVFGAGGFVGSHLCEELLSKRVKVVGLDQFSAKAKHNTEHISVNHDLVFEFDKTDELLEKVVRADYVFFLHKEGELEEDQLLGLIRFTAKHDCRFLFGQSFEEGYDKEEKLVAENCQQDKINFRLVRWLDCFGPRMDLSGNVFGETLKNAAKRKALLVQGNEEDFVYPVFVKDVVGGILKAQIASGTKGKTFTFSGDKMSMHGFAQKVKTVAGDLPVEFVQTGQTREELVPEIITAGQKLISWEPGQDLSQAIRETLSWFDRNLHRLDEKDGKVVAKPKLKKPQETKNNQTKVSFWSKAVVGSQRKEQPKTEDTRRVKKRWIILPLFFLALLFWVLALPVVQLLAGYAQLQIAKDLLSNGKGKEAVVWQGRSVFWFQMASKSFSSWLLVPGLKNTASRLVKKSVVFSQFSQTGKQTTLVLEQLKGLKRSVFNKEPFSLEEDLIEMQASVDTLVRESGFLEAELAGKDLLLPFLHSPIVEFEGLQNLRKSLSFGQEILAVLPELLGQDGKKTYLVVLVNNTKAMPGGGIVNSAALVTFEKGRMINLEVLGEGTIGAQLKGEVSPPEPLEKYMGLTNWNLTYSAWSADFAAFANRAAWFVEKELEQEVDGVVAYDLEHVKNTILKSKNLELENGDSVNENNLYAQAGQTNKDFYTALNRSFLKYFAYGKDIELQDLFGLVNSVEEKHVSFWTKNSRANSVLAKYGWGGGVKSVSCDLARKFENCAADYLQVLEANLVQGKIGGNLNKSYALEIDVKEGVLAHRMTITLESKASLLSSGVHKSYLQLLVPAAAKLEMAAIVDANGQQTEVVIEQGSEKGKRSYGTYVEMPEKETRQLVFLWDVPWKGGKINESELVFLWQKQKGALAEPLVLRVNLPEEGLRVGAYPEPSLTGNGVLGYNTSLIEDLLFNLIWQPK